VGYSNLRLIRPIGTKPTSSSAQGRIVALDGLRGAAILLVVVWHYFYFYPDPNHHPTALLPKLYVYFERCIALGWSGVDLFFVLSGFLIGGILIEVRTSPSYFRTFYLRRCFRIIPVYYAWIALYILLLLGFSFARHVGSIGEPRIWYELGAQFVFFQNLGFIHYSGVGGAWFTATWSLAVEEQFYLVAPMIVRWLTSRALFWLLIVVVLLAPFLRVLVHYCFPPTMGLDPAYILMPCRADSLAIGMLVAILWRRPQSHRWLEDHRWILYNLFGVFLSGVVALLTYSPSPRSIAMQSVGFSWLAIFFALLLLLTLVNPEGPIASLASMRWLRELGNVSYCLYIIHQAVNLFCHAILQPAMVGQSDWRVIAVPVVACIVSYLIAKLSFTYFEQPLLRRGHTFKY
jgi:peptidoglycan/LPS O-acetylase OafA/YrhL